jgi:hypothetical protein
MDLWRALTPESRAAAWAAARSGGAPSDDLAPACLAHGHAMVSRYQLAFGLLLGLLAIIFFPSFGALLAFGGHSLAAVAVGLVFAAAVAALLVVVLQWDRYARLESSARLAYEAASASAPAVAVPAGPVEIRVRRASYSRRLVVMTIVGVYGWIQLGHNAWHLHTTVNLFWLAGFVVLAWFGTVGSAAILPVLAQPVVARFTPDGWQLPGARLAGTWAEVRGIQVWARRPGRGVDHTPSGTRHVVLLLADPQAHLSGAPPWRRLSPWRRYLARRRMRRFGSPVVFEAHIGRTIGVVPLVDLLHGYTPAPVSWGRPVAVPSGLSGGEGTLRPAAGR